MLVGALARVERRFDGALHADLPPVAALCRHIESYRGKMLRPTMAILCGCAASGGRAAPGSPGVESLPDGLIAVGAVVEMVHMATLVHDDVLDEADTRRRVASVNSLHGNEAAVILGDYLIAAAYHLCAGLDDPHYARRIGRVSMDVCSGELLQLHHREDFTLPEATYFQIVTRKTGALVAVACELGARAMGADRGAQESMHEFGRDLGVAFQIQDDLLDLTGEEATVGKSVRKDLEKGKLTLPLIHHLQAADPARRAATLDYLMTAARGGEDLGAAADADFAAALDQTASVGYAEGVARRLVAQAKGTLRGLPRTPMLAMLDSMADAVVERAF